MTNANQTDGNIDSPPAQTPGRAFVAGLTQPSLPAIGIALCVVAVLAATVLVCVTPDFMASDAHRYLAARPSDDYLFLTSKILSLPLSPPGELSVFVLGASGDREVLATSKEMSEDLSRRVGQRVRVHKFTPNALSVWEMEVLAEHLPAEFPGVVVLGLGTNPPRYLHDRERLAELIRHPRLGIVSETLDSRAKQAGIDVPTRTGIYALDNHQFVLARLSQWLDHVNRGPIDSREYRLQSDLAADLASDPQAYWQAGVAAGREWRDWPGKSRAMGWTVLQSTVRALRARNGVRVVLLESPINPRFVRAIWEPEAFAAFRDGIRSFARREGALYWDLNQAAGLTESDFHDWSHIRTTEARVRFTAALLDRLTPLLKKAGAERSPE